MLTGVSTPEPISSQEKVFPAVRSKKDAAHTMHAVEWFGTRKVRVVETPRPLVTEPKDAIIRTTASTICGSDLHLYNNEFAGMEKGDIIGHEAIGIVEEVGPGVSKFKKGDRVVISAVIACGQCFYCDKGLFSCCDNTNPSAEMEQQYGHRTAALFGYSHLTGGWDGCQAEYVRVPFADVNLLRLPENLPDEKALVLADIACTGWHATELGNVSQGDVVGVWGCGPVGLMAQAWSKFRKASRVIAIDSDPYRLSVAKEQLGCETINFAEENVTRRLQELVPRGLDVAIEAAGFRFSKGVLHGIQRKLKLETDTPQMLNECIMAVRKGGIISVVGDYFQACNGFMIGAFMEKGQCMRGGQVFVQRYWEQLLGYIQDGSFDPSWIFTHHMSLDDAAEAYRIFDKHEQNVLKILLRPHTDVPLGSSAAASSSSTFGAIGTQNPI